jgi:SHS2 domain-containing protein
MPFEELDHTADWSMRVWAPDLSRLFIDACKGMNALSGIRLAKGPRVARKITASATDTVGLLVSFLSEIIYYNENKHLAFDHFAVELTIPKDQPCRLSAILSGAPILNINKSIKAVTYHDLLIQPKDEGYEARIVFDV